MLRQAYNSEPTTQGTPCSDPLNNQDRPRSQEVPSPNSGYFTQAIENMHGGYRASSQVARLTRCNVGEVAEWLKAVVC